MPIELVLVGATTLGCASALIQGLTKFRYPRVARAALILATATTVALVVGLFAYALSGVPF